MTQTHIEDVDVTIEVPPSLLHKLRQAARNGRLVYDFEMDEGGVILMTPVPVSDRRPDPSDDN